MSTDLDIKTDSLEGMMGQSNNDLRLGRYGFFAPDTENRYSIADENAQEQLNEVRNQPFSPSFHGQAEDTAGAAYLQSQGVLENPAAYTAGLFDEAGTQATSLILSVFLIAAACLAAFFASGRWRSYTRRRKESKCTSPSL